MPSFTQHQPGYSRLVIIRNTVGPNAFEASMVIPSPIPWWEWDQRKHAKANARKIIELKREIARRIARS